MQTQSRQFFELSFSASGQIDDYFPAILRVVYAANQTQPLQPVDPLNGGVVPHLQPLGKRANRGGRAARHAADRQQKLVLLRLETGGPNRVVRGVQEQANAISEFRESLVARIIGTVGHTDIISCNDIFAQTAGTACLQDYSSLRYAF